MTDSIIYSVKTANTGSLIFDGDLHVLTPQLNGRSTLMQFSFLA